MKKILQISIEVNSGSVGRIAEQIGEKIIENNWESYITFARNNLPSKSKTIRIGNRFDVLWHVFMTRIFDNHCFESKKATRKLIEKIQEIKPDIIHLHHLHGYFINIEILFDYLSKSDIPVVWTFHDCWSFTGHCAYFDFVACDKWKTECYQCPQKKEYPKSLIVDRSKKNFWQKKSLFNSVKKMTIVPVSFWLGDLVKQSFLGGHSVKVIQNGINLDNFKKTDSRAEIKAKYKIAENSFIILGVASTWDRRKGLAYFIKMSEMLDDSHQIVLVGLSKKQLKEIPKNIIGIERTENVQQLAALYSAADVFANPTLEDTFPTTNLESLACGTPVITFKTGGSPESITEETGIVVPKGDLNALIEGIQTIKKNTKEYYSKQCEARAVNNYNKDVKFEDYIALYKELLG